MHYLTQASSTKAMNNPHICVIGHPFAPSGVGQLARAVIDGFLAAGKKVSILDCHGHFASWPNYSEFLVGTVSSKVNVYCINGNEVEEIIDKHGSLNSVAQNIIYPAWELPRYPESWANQLAKFDEVWSMSEFSAASFNEAVVRPVRNVSIAVSPSVNHYHSRGHFHLNGSAYVFFFTFDFTSFSMRKNPHAVIEAFRRCLKARPFADILLLIKAGNSHRAPQEMKKLREEVGDMGQRVMLIDQILTDDEIKSLLLNTDAFVSLHRSEGFGLSIAEAMYFEKPVIATAYSGNMDFMTEDTALLVDYELVAVKPGEYPHHEGQVWAEPSVEHAARHMIALVDNPEMGRNIGRKASRAIRNKLNPMRLGMRMVERLMERGAI